MPTVRKAISDMQTQRIGEVSRIAIGDPDVIPLWFGEPDLDTPEFIRRAAIDAMQAGHTIEHLDYALSVFDRLLKKYEIL